MFSRHIADHSALLSIRTHEKSFTFIPINRSRLSRNEFVNVDGFEPPHTAVSEQRLYHLAIRSYFLSCELERNRTFNLSFKRRLLYLIELRVHI